MTILVSACLLGLACRYDGCAKENPAVLALRAHHTLIPFCPETYGGLPTPRLPSEIRGDRVVARDGADVTAAFARGAQEALKLVRLLGCDCALLQDRSPSCGCRQVYSGQFDGQLRAGQGVAAAALATAGVTLFDEQQLTEAARWLAANEAEHAPR